MDTFFCKSKKLVTLNQVPCVIVTKRHVIIGIAYLKFVSKLVVFN